MSESVILAPRVRTEKNQGFQCLISWINNSQSSVKVGDGDFHECLIWHGMPQSWLSNIFFIRIWTKTTKRILHFSLSAKGSSAHWGGFIVDCYLVQLVESWSVRLNWQNHCAIFSTITDFPFVRHCAIFRPVYSDVGWEQTRAAAHTVPHGRGLKRTRLGRKRTAPTKDMNPDR